MPPKKGKKGRRGDDSDDDDVPAKQAAPAAEDEAEVQVSKSQVIFVQCASLDA